jgi:hypothetical protein
MIGERPEHFPIGIHVAPIDLFVGEQQIDGRAPQVTMRKVTGRQIADAGLSNCNTTCPAS